MNTVFSFLRVFLISLWHQNVSKSPGLTFSELWSGFEPRLASLDGEFDFYTFSLSVLQCLNFTLFVCKLKMTFYERPLHLFNSVSGEPA